MRCWLRDEFVDKNIELVTDECRLLSYKFILLVTILKTQSERDFIANTLNTVKKSPRNKKISLVRQGEVPLHAFIKFDGFIGHAALQLYCK